MRALSAAELLDIWEQGRSRAPIQQALLLLAAASPNAPVGRLAALPIGQRDAYLLRLREWSFGSKMDCLVTCPECGARLELTLDVADIRVTDLNPSASTKCEASADPIEMEESEGTLSVRDGDYEVTFRLPNSLDLVAIADSQDAEIARHMLLESCLLTARCGSKGLTASDLPGAVVETVIDRMAQVDPQANLQLALDCPTCNHSWLAIFDIASFLWNELSSWAQRTFYQVHTLARAYGWSEADILALSPWRRQLYLDLVSE